MNNKIKLILTLLIALVMTSQTAQSEENYLLSFKSTNSNFKTDTTYDSQASIHEETDELFVISNNKFVSTGIPNKDRILFHSHPEKKPEVKLFKGEVTKNAELYDVITLQDSDLTDSPLEQLNCMLETTNPSETIQPLVFKEKKTSPFINRLKTVYFLTSLSAYIGQSTQIEDAFTKGEKLTGGGVSKSDQYGYNNIFRNFMNPFERSYKGAKLDDSGPTVNYFQHPMFGFGVASYLTASGASAKEVFLVSILDNFLFEFVAEGTYVAPSGIDFLTTSGGAVAGYLATKYIFKKPFSAFLKGTGALKEKYHVNFDPILAPGDTGKGVKIGSQITFKH